MFATRKADLKTYTCASYIQCRIEESSTNLRGSDPLGDFVRDELRGLTGGRG
ncbi:hypothetical protein [Agrobacterium rubi]|uniref:Uncharacterized protein n=1 Tax=Agrobacterium rubi TaxID=28099 RepID=A0AAE7USJ0_9HYPH|nr:hypothetical protein [Agrobacterium rubi]NTE90106.1 hypothetical protein [Agrobacterium rubi]NTF05936.1 hypothetical protein [Agrobacterium rubi]NTF39440.1 hypothetical protein [Agrobacterium rubi]QTG03894.1 hypothetical protein G6M88_25955 [Agrobacterium rubi]